MNILNNPLKKAKAQLIARCAFNSENNTIVFMNYSKYYERKDHRNNTNNTL